jgi:hypothetical protein
MGLISNCTHCPISHEAKHMFITKISAEIIVTYRAINDSFVFRTLYFAKYYPYKYDI